MILWDVASAQIVRRFTGHSAAVRDVAFSPEGNTALSGSDDKTLILWDIRTGEPIRHFVGQNAKVYGVALSPDGSTALSGSADFSIILWDVPTGQPIRRFTGWPRAVSRFSRPSIGGSPISIPSRTGARS